MCGIIGLFAKDAEANQYQKMLTCLETMQARGKDGVGITEGQTNKHATTLAKLPKISGNHLLGHNLHAIVGNVAQPFLDTAAQTAFAANCEIYNWKELKTTYELASQNDAELIFDLIKKIGVSKTIKALDGVYAFAYWDVKQKTVTIARDLLGVKPLWYTADDSGFFFASEKKALHAAGFYDAQIHELNPRTVISVHTKTGKIQEKKRSFFTNLSSLKSAYPKLMAKTKELLYSAIKKRIPEGKEFGLLFSGGIDSTFLAYVFKEMGLKFTCYTAALEEKGMETAQDLIHAKRIAKEYGFPLKIKKLSVAQTEQYIKTVVPLIEDNNVVKTGVALTFFAACELAKKDGIKVIFSGLGSEEIFAGYERHKHSTDINKECVSGLLKMYERDLYRDDVITMYHNLELRLPFLDKALVSYALTIPPTYKLDPERNKIILRDIAAHIGIDAVSSERKKKAAQYGSKFHKALQKIARKHHHNKISAYLQTIYTPPNLKLGSLWSTGKDGAFAAWTMQKQNYDIACLITIESENPDSYMFHTPNVSIAKLHAEAYEKPLVVQKTKGEKEIELSDLRKAISTAKEKYDVQGVVTGALYSNYQRERIEKVCDELNLKIFSPLWHIDQEKEMRTILDDGFEIIFSSVAAYGLDKSWLGRTITHEDVDRLVYMNEKYKMHVAGEGGEFESLVLDAPFFTKKVVITKHTSYFDSDGQGRFIVEEAKLVSKTDEVDVS